MLRRSPGHSIDGVGRQPISQGDAQSQQEKSEAKCAGDLGSLPADLLNAATLSLMIDRPPTRVSHG